MLIEFNGYSSKVYINPEAVSGVTIGLQDIGVMAANVWLIGTPYPVMVRASVEEVVEQLRGEQPEMPPVEPAHPLRAEYDSMMPHQQAHFGSFDAYVAMHEKLDAPEPELQVKWIAAADLTEDQIKGAMGEHNGNYAINVDDLTDEQRAM